MILLFKCSENLNDIHETLLSPQHTLRWIDLFRWRCITVRYFIIEKIRTKCSYSIHFRCVRVCCILRTNRYYSIFILYLLCVSELIHILPFACGFSLVIRITCVLDTLLFFHSIMHSLSFALDKTHIYAIGQEPRTKYKTFDQTCSSRVEKMPTLTHKYD